MKRYLTKLTTLPMKNPNRFCESVSTKDHTKNRKEILLDRMMVKKKMEEIYQGRHRTIKVR